MALGGVSERVALLRRTIAGLEAGGASDSADPLADRLPLGAVERPFWLDAALGGGLARGALYEASPGAPGDEWACCAFALGLAARFAQRHAGPVVWIIEDFAIHDNGAPYGPGLDEWGLDPARLLLVRAADAKGALWALEEALKCQACAAVVGELWSAMGRFGEAAPRRLALAARRGGAPCILTHPTRRADGDCPGARARFAIYAAAGASLGPLWPPVLGRPSFAVEILKTRLDGARAILPDSEKKRVVLWDRQDILFHEPPSVAGDRTAVAERGISAAFERIKSAASARS